MKDNPPNHGFERAIEREATDWVVREERGLSPEELDALSQWLAADPRHGEALRERRWVWREFDRLAGLPATVARGPDPDLLAPLSFQRRRARCVRSVAAWVGTAAAAATVLWLALPREESRSGDLAVRPFSTALAAPCERQTLDDGSVIELNRGARAAVDFSDGVRAVRLERGEAHFTVAKNSSRPFVVKAGEVTVRAVGTDFNVRLATADVEVVVAEGRVSVGHETMALVAPAVPVLDARQRVVMPLREGSTTPIVATLSEKELATRLSWQPRMLDFSDARLAVVVDELNQRNPVQLVLGAATLRDLRVNASVRSDNVEGFVRLLESSFDLRAEWRCETEIVLRPSR